MNTLMDLDLGLIHSIRVNGPAARRDAHGIVGRRSVKREAQMAWLIRAIQCMDLTTLSGDDTSGKVRRLCTKALNPVRHEILAAHLGEDHDPLTVGAVCVYHAHVAEAVQLLGGKIPVAAVSTGFPHGQSPLNTRLVEIEQSIDAGAREIDVVIPRELALTGQWEALYKEIVEMRQACGENAKLKVILGTGNLGTLEVVAKASACAIMAGADTIKTSTGKEPKNATLPVGLVMAREIRRFRDEVPAEQRRIVGFKPAGGIRTASDALRWQILMLEELGQPWMLPDLFRFGASSLLTDIERQLELHATGRYAARYHQPAA